MRNTFLILFLLFFSVTFVNAQMNTDNSYLRKNYQESKTAKKAAERKARRQALKEARRQKKAETQKDSQKDTLKNTETLALSSSKYLEGAISTTKDGVVFFEKLFPVGAKSKQQIFDVLKMYAEKKISETEELEISRILSDSNDTLVATICEPMYFKKKKWESDSTLIQYQYFVTTQDSSVSLRIWFISYCYEQGRAYGFNYKAEEWITDKYALSKDKLSLLKLPGKFRSKTIDHITGIFNEIEQQMQ